MPIVMQPARPTPTQPTKDIRMDAFEAEGPYAEHFTILDYLHATTHDEARKAGTIIKVPAQSGKPAVEEWSQSAYIAYLLDKQLKGWSLIAPPVEMVPHLTPEEYAKRTQQGPKEGVRWWRFLPENVAELPDPVKGWLLGEILACTGVIATRDIVVRNKKGTVLDFRHAHGSLGARAGEGVPDPDRD